LSASCALALGAASVNAQTPSWSMYQPYTNSTFVPFVSALSSTQGALVNLAVGPSGNMSSPQAVTMDTGSIGIQVSADNWNPGSLTPIGPGSINLNSSGVTNSGNFYSVPVNFFNGGTNVATANVPVLVVTKSVTCPPGGGSCTTNNDPRGVFYMGVGLNRTAGENLVTPNAQLVNGQTLNPFLNITQIPGQAVSASTIRPGYIINTANGATGGVTLGLTQQNTQGMSFVKLGTNASGSLDNWNTAPMSVTVTNGGQSSTASSGGNPPSGSGVLPDAGINYMFLSPVPSNVVTQSCTLSGGTRNCLPDGAQVQVSLPGSGAASGLAQYSFTVGGTGSNVVQPAAVVTLPGSAFVNTGREFFLGFQYLYDSVGGYVGYAAQPGLGASGSVNLGVALIGQVDLADNFSNSLPVFLIGDTTLAQTGSGSITSAIAGAFGLTIGSGSITLGGANTYTGGTTVAAGASLTGTTSSLQGNIVDNGSVTFSQATAGTYAGNISGTGSVGITGGGTIIFSGTNSYTGGTIVSGGGTVAIDSDMRLGDPSGGLALNNGTLLAGAIITSSRAVTLGTGGGTFNTNGTAMTMATGVTGLGGLTKAGVGTLNLEGINSYTGGTTVAAGTLNLTGSMIGSLNILAGATFTTTGGWELASGASFSNAGTFQSVGGGPLVNQGTLVNNGVLTANLNNSGRLSGTGTINGTVTNLSGGIVAPGNSIGTLNVVGAFTQAAGSTYQVETNSAGQADRINVSGAPGTATIAGGTVTLTAATGVYAPSTTYTILNATGGVTGTYASANSLYPFLQPSLSYDANNVYLTLKPGGFGAGAATPNQAAVGRVLDQSVAGSSGDLATVIGTMATYTASQGQVAMNAISGQNYSGFGTANLGGGLLFMNALGQQMGLARGGFGGGTRVAVAQACETGLADADACDGSVSPWSLWGSALGGTGSIAGNANAGTLTYNAGGVATGADYRFDPRLLAGFGVGFSSGNQWASGFSGQGTTNSYQASLYASFTQGAFYLDGLAGYGYNDNQMTRQIVLPNLAARTAQGRTGANQFLAQAEAGYRIGIYEPAALSISPFVRFQGMTNSQTGFSESGAGALNLTVAPQTTGSARSVLGAEFAGAFGPEGREKLAVQMRLGWAHEYANTARPVTASFAGAPGANFTVFGAAPQTDSAVFSLAASTAVAQGVSLYARYDGEVGTGTSTHALNGGLRVTW